MATIVNDMLPLPVLKLDVSGMNWAVVLLWFKTAIQEKGLWDYFDGSHLCLRQKKLTESRYLKQVNSKAIDVGSKSPLSTTVVTPESIKIWKQNRSLAMT